MKVSRKTFGLLSNGKKVHLYVLKAGELTLCVSTLGATWTSLTVPSKRMGADDVLLGYSSFDGYVNNGFYGVTVGRFANRIAGAKFTLDGKEYTLEKNAGEHSLHGGSMGFNRRLWEAESYEDKNGVFVRFELKSPDGDGGFPGNLWAVVCYGLTKSNEIVVDYEAKVDAPSPVNLTNHAYFNLAGEGSRVDILATELKLYCSSCLEVDEALIPTGKILPVKNTPFDFTNRKPIGRDIAALTQTGGYDHCFVVDGEGGKLRPFAEVHEPSTGRTMKGFTTQPGLQLYTCNNIPPHSGKIGSIYKSHGAFCLETQHYPDSPNHPEFPSSIFSPDRDYHEKAVFAFDW
ncbi:MAG: galactose mutarotase [Treponema sp.]|jgi:aldose 1-epimerase|nr:galactose mutarotase [Treponema sp.]